MTHVDSVGNLQKMTVKPLAWRIYPDCGFWVIRFQWQKDDSWYQVRTARGLVKSYKRINTALRDVWSISANATPEIFPYRFDTGH